MPNGRPPPLDYSAPPVFFEGMYYTRTRSAIIVAALVGTLGSLAITAGLRSAMDESRLLLIGLGSLCLLMACWSVWQWLADDRRPIRVTEDGIETERRVWVWPRIARVGALRWNDGIMLVFHTRDAPLNERVIHTIPPLADDDYQRLRVELEHYFLTRDIAVTVDREIHSD